MTAYDHPLVDAIREQWPGATVNIQGGCMKDPNEHETAALKAAGYAGGEILETAGADLSAWTADQYDSFVGAIVGAYIDALFDIESKARQAAVKVRSSMP